jgi:hypothetical protein
MGINSRAPQSRGRGFDRERSILTRDPVGIAPTSGALTAEERIHQGIVLEEGRILEAGPWIELLRAPRSRLLEVFKERLGTVPQSARTGS